MSKRRSIDAYQRVKLARLSNRPNVDYYIKNIFDDFIELHGDRNYRDDKAIIGGIASLNGINVTVIGIAKGTTTKENIERNFGMPSPEGYRKALRLMKQAEKFNRPVICFVDTPGAFCGVGAEERGQGEAIASNLLAMSTLKTPIISIIIGEGGSGGALALALADEVWMLENSIYSILSVEGFATILWKDVTRAKEAANAMKITSYDLLDYGIIEKVIKEPIGGAQSNPEMISNSIKNKLYKRLKYYNNIEIDGLLNSRYEKFRKIR